MQLDLDHTTNPITVGCLEPLCSVDPQSALLDRLERLGLLDAPSFISPVMEDEDEDADIEDDDDDFEWDDEDEEFEEGEDEFADDELEELDEDDDDLDDDDI